MQAMLDSVHGRCAQAVSNALIFFESFSGKNMTFSEKETARDVVSEADLAIQTVMLRGLHESGWPVISEEKENNFEILRNAEICWVLDPIDGTANYSENIPFYGISLGALKAGEFFAGAFGMPATKELFYTINQDIAYLNEVRLKVLPKTLRASLVAASFSSPSTARGVEREREFLLFVRLNDRSKGALRLGSASGNICYTAAGRFGLSYGLNNKIWDVAGPLAIAKAAGCQVVTSPIDPSGRISFVVGHPAIIEEVRSEFQPFIGSI